MIEQPTLFDYADLQSLSDLELYWLEALGRRWESTDPQYWDATDYAKWQKLGGNEWMRVRDDPRLGVWALNALVERGWAEQAERKWWNTETVCLQVRITRDGIDAFKRLEGACLAAYFKLEQRWRTR